MAVDSTKQTKKALQKPVLCGKCKTIHYEYQLACKRCGNYFDTSDFANGSSKGGTMVVTLVVAMAAAAAVCHYLHIF